MNRPLTVPRLELRQKVASEIRSIFNAPDLPHAEARLAELVKTHQKASPKLAQWLESNLPDGFAVFALPERHRLRLRTSNMAERLHREVKRRSRVASLFPNEASVLRLVTAIHIEISEDWETGRAYLTN